MKILLTGATGYIGKRLLPLLVENGHEVVCCVRDPKRFSPPDSVKSHVTVVQVDLLNVDTLINIPKDINGAFYLVHSMSSSSEYQFLEQESARNFRDAMDATRVNHVVYLSGIVNETTLSEHLTSRKNVETILANGNYHLTTLRAGIIVGSGSASFEIMRDLVEKLPVMVTPRWLNTKCQPIAIADVLQLLTKTIFNTATFNKNYDIGGPDVLTYKEMLLEFGRVRKLKRFIYTIPVMTPKLSSYWLYFVTSTSYRLAIALVNSMKVEVICRDNEIEKLLNVQPIGYTESLERAFVKIERNEVISSWKDSFSSSNFDSDILEYIQVPTFGCFTDIRKRKFESKQHTVDDVWSVGGETGWYANWLWELRGFIDKLYGGVGIRRGRTSETSLNTGDALDFWRVLYADKSEGRLLLFAEMKLPGEAWLEFRIQGNELVQIATFRPLGLYGRLYWYSILPLHSIIFSGMIRKLTR